MGWLIVFYYIIVGSAVNKVAETLGINITSVADTIRYLENPHWMEGVWKGLNSKFWASQTIAANTVHGNKEEDLSLGNLIGSSGNSPDVNLGNFVCKNNNPVFCAIEFVLAFSADINVRKMNKPMLDQNNCDLV